MKTLLLALSLVVPAAHALDGGTQADRYRLTQDHLSEQCVEAIGRLREVRRRVDASIKLTTGYPEVPVEFVVFLNNVRAALDADERKLARWQGELESPEGGDSYEIRPELERIEARLAELEGLFVGDVLPAQ